VEAHYHPQTKAVYPRYGHGLICYYTVFISLFLAALAKKFTALVLRCGIHKAEHGRDYRVIETVVNMAPR
jgi:hypothetical protein